MCGAFYCLAAQGLRLAAYGLRLTAYGRADHAGAGLSGSADLAMVRENAAVTLREMTLADVEAGLRLCRLSHWNQLARDWEQFLVSTPAGAVVAEDAAGQVVGSVATMRYAGARGGPSVAWLAMVLVDPAVRGRGVGTALLHEGIARVADVPAVGLDATPLGQPLYTRLGFRVSSGLTRLTRVGPVLWPAAPDAGVRVATADDDDEIARLDTQATGLDRRHMLTWLREGAPELAWVHQRHDRLDGIVLGRPGHTFVHLGPIIAASTDTAMRLLRAALAASGTAPVIIDAADAHASFRGGLEALGFTAQRPFARMYRGAARPAGDPSHLFAIIGPEFG
jgi:predicted N-acetyltransferase YhbS